MSRLIAREEDGLVYASLAQLLRLEQPAQQLSFTSRQALTSILAGQHNSRLRGRGLPDRRDTGAKSPGQSSGQGSSACNRPRRPVGQTALREDDFAWCPAEHSIFPYEYIDSDKGPPMRFVNRVTPATALSLAGVTG